ncbi:MAG: hypothetical protein L0227_02950 [Chloroflexi bacterium]|nr:hypothetical protein [Chloroflexota bacterium]
MARRRGPPRRTVGIEIRGPFFDNGPGATFRENVRKLMAGVASQGERRVRDAIAGIPPAGVRTGDTRRRIRGRVRSLTGKRWQYAVVISPSTAGLSRRDAIGVRAAASAIEARHHVFRRISRTLAKPAGLTDLLKGLD